LLTTALDDWLSALRLKFTVSVSCCTKVTFVEVLIALTTAKTVPVSALSGAVSVAVILPLASVVPLFIESVPELELIPKSGKTRSPDKEVTARWT